MASKTAAKPARPAAKSTVKTPGKDTIKSEKLPTSVLEIVPGKFNETDWLSLLENDDTEDFIADIFDNIWTDTSKQIQQIYIRRQLLPFTLMMTENALSNVIQWAFLERDQPKPANGDFWRGDEEPIPCSMDNWGEGVVPACREEQPQSVEDSPISVPEQSPSSALNLQTPEDLDKAKRSSSSLSKNSLIHSDTQTKEFENTDDIYQFKQITNNDNDHHSSPDKESSSRPSSACSSIRQQIYNRRFLFMQTQAPKIEPLPDLFNPTPQIQTSSSFPNATPSTLSTKRQRFVAPKASSQLGSDALASTTNITETTTTMKSLKKIESKLFDEQHVEEAISKAPAAAHSMLKSILSRPPGYRELELDDFGNVISIAKLDPDKLAPRSIRVKCDIVKPRKAAIETRPLPKQAPPLNVSRSEPKFAPVKLVLPEHSSDVGDLIQPVPGVLYEDSKTKKGDPRRYKNALSKYTNFHDENRSLRPIAQRNNIAILQVANDLLRKSKDYNNDDDERDSPIPKLHRLAPIPPIMSASSTTSV